jgi:hypothetical protein
MIAYKAFQPGLICLGHQFVMGLNTTDKSNCRANGFHCAENPLDFLTYYPKLDESEYYLVDARGDMDEDGSDTKIACTELAIIKRLTREEFFLHGLAYLADHPLLQWSDHVTKDLATARNGYAVVRGLDPVAKGTIGDILAFAKENPVDGTITQVALARVDGAKILRMCGTVLI